MTTEAFDYKQIATDYLKTWEGNITFGWEEWTDPNDDSSAYIETSSTPKSDRSGSYWWQTDHIEVTRCEIVGPDSDEPELMIVYVEADVTSSEGHTSDANVEGVQDTDEMNYCIWINQEGNACHWEDGETDGYDPEIQSRIDQLLTSKIK
jgi:hypothetical protein